MCSLVNDVKSLTLSRFVKSSNSSGADNALFLGDLRGTFGVLRSDGWLLTHGWIVDTG